MGIKANASVTISEIANNLKIPPSTVDSRLIAIDNLPTGPHLWQNGMLIGIFR